MGQGARDRSWELVRVLSESQGKIAMSLGGFVGKFGSAGASPSQLKNLSEFCQSCDAKFLSRWEGRAPARPKKNGRSAVRRKQE